VIKSSCAVLTLLASNRYAILAAKEASSDKDPKKASEKMADVIVANNVVAKDEFRLGHTKVTRNLIA